MTWIVYTNGVDAAQALHIVNTRYLRDQSLQAAEAKLVNLSNNILVDEATVIDADLGPFYHALPGKRSGALVTEGITERWDELRETASGDFAFTLPTGKTAANYALPSGFTETETEPIFPQPEL